MVWTFVKRWIFLILREVGKLKKNEKTILSSLDGQEGGYNKKDLISVAETEMSGGCSCISGNANVASVAEMHARMTQIILA